jgi:hypothetical protein
VWARPSGFADSTISITLGHSHIAENGSAIFEPLKAGQTDSCISCGDAIQ